MSPIGGLINTPNLNFCLFSSKTQVHQLKKNVSNSATQDSIMNAHNKTQLTLARINYALKYSCCDTPLSKIFKLTILSSNASWSSTKVIKCPQIKKDFMFTHNGSQFKVPESISLLKFTKTSIMHELTHRFARLFQSTFVSAHSR